MKTIKIKTPAKLNLTLEIVNKREDGFHNIKSIMQTIDLHDYLTISIEEGIKQNILLTGNSTEIPYNEKNLVYKSTEIFFKYINTKNPEYLENKKYNVSINIEKNIPISAGLAGGSTNGAGTIYGLNKLFNNILTDSELHNLCATLGSDLNVCLKGGCLLATSRGEIIQPVQYRDYDVSLIKPLNLGISAKEAYTKYSLLKSKPKTTYTENMIDALAENKDISPFLYNDLELAVFNDYTELQAIKKLYPKSIMSGSGSTYFSINTGCKTLDGYFVKNNLHFINHGVKEM